MPRMTHEFHPSVLREYDIRGVYGETLTEADAYAIGWCFATEVRNEGGSRVAVGYDGRLSSPQLEQALVEGLNASGVDVVRIGMGPTPMLYYATVSMEDVQGGIQVTGSHNPSDHNGFKMVLGGRPFFGADIRRFAVMAASGEWLHSESSERAVRSETHEFLPLYIDRLLKGFSSFEVDDVSLVRQNVQVTPSHRSVGLRDLNDLRIAWDAGNGAAGPALEALTVLLPGEHHVLFSEVDGRFPNHHPDPTVPENLSDLRAFVVENCLDFGFAFDGDADRIGVIDSLGRVIDADQLLAIFARDVLSRHPGGKVIMDVKASRLVADTVRALGGVTEVSPSGHSHLKAKMNETGAVLGGETSAHIFFADAYYGYDDAIYAALRLILATRRLGASVAELRDSLPEMINTPEMRFPVPQTRKFPVIEEVRERLLKAGADVNDLDGVRVNTADGWWLLRASNTQEVLTARAESDTVEGLERLVSEIDQQLALSGLSR